MKVEDLDCKTKKSESNSQQRNVHRGELLRCKCYCKTKKSESNSQQDLNAKDHFISCKCYCKTKKSESNSQPMCWRA